MFTHRCININIYIYNILYLYKAVLIRKSCFSPVVRRIDSVGKSSVLWQETRKFPNTSTISNYWSDSPVPNITSHRHHQKYNEFICTVSVKLLEVRKKFHLRGSMLHPQSCKLVMNWWNLGDYQMLMKSLLIHHR